MDVAMSALRGIGRTYLKDYVFIFLVILYVLGPLEYVSSFIPTLWSLPAIFIVSGLVWNAIEAKLSKPRVEPDGKAIFISGCDSGFGFELAKRMAGKGFDVYAGCLFPDGEGAKAFADLPNIFVVGYDVTKDDSVADAVAEIRKRLENDKKTLWGVVANAGIALFGPFEWFSMEDIQRVFDVNVFGVIRTVKAFLPLLKGSRGRFIITSSMSGLTSVQFLVAYSMTKSAVKSLTEGLRRELGRHSKVHFISLMPTFHRTPMMERASTAELERRFDALPEDERNTANRKFLERAKQEHYAVSSLLTVTDLTGPLRCFDHALTSRRPRPHYICDRTVMHYILYPIINHFPVESIDYLFTGFHKVGKALMYLTGVRTESKVSEKNA